MVKLPFDDRFWAKVEKTERCWNWTGYTRADGYAITWMKDRKKYVHRISWEISRGPIPSGMDLDHICHNTRCVNPDHLRITTRKQNMEHRIAAHSNSSTGVRGVYWSKEKRKYCARVAHNRRTYHAGYFDSVAEAEAAVTQKRLELFTHNDMDGWMA